MFNARYSLRKFCDKRTVRNQQGSPPHKCQNGHGPLHSHAWVPVHASLRCCQDRLSSLLPFPSRSPDILVLWERLWATAPCEAAAKDQHPPKQCYRCSGISDSQEVVKQPRKGRTTEQRPLFQNHSYYRALPHAGLCSKHFTYMTYANLTTAPLLLRGRYDNYPSILQVGKLIQVL